MSSREFHGRYVQDEYNPADDYPEYVECPYCGEGAARDPARTDGFRCSGCSAVFSEVEAEHAAVADREARES